MEFFLLAKALAKTKGRGRVASHTGFNPWPYLPVYSILLAFLLVLSAGCLLPGQRPEGKGFEKGFIEGRDGKIAYIYKDGSEKAILFIHQMNGRKEDWLELMENLSSHGFSVMAIDLRGHGESWGNWRNFGDREFAGMADDVAMAMEWLEKRNRNVYAVVGASIGANLALNTDAEKVVALSPGLSYRGIVARKRDALIIVGKQDSYSYQSSLELGNPVVVDCPCHGMALLDYRKDVIVDYLTGDSQ